MSTLTSLEMTFSAKINTSISKSLFVIRSYELLIANRFLIFLLSRIEELRPANRTHVGVVAFVLHAIYMPRVIATAYRAKPKRVSSRRDIITSSLFPSLCMHGCSAP